MKRLAGMLALLALPAQAYVSDAGHFYEVTCNRSGVVLTSTYPVGRFFGYGAGTTISEDRETIYLGKSCDATRTGFPPGTWGFANGGFLVEFPGMRIGFPRQEVFCPDGTYPDMAACRL